MGYLAPDAAVSSSWQDHKDRNPPSSEPGTDYATAYGTPVAAPFAGVVIETKASNSGAMGRFVAIAFDDGRSNRALHLSEVWVSSGTRVQRGQHIGASGASGNGSDWYYGPHVHETLWPAGYWEDPTIDFAVYAGEEPTPEPPILEDDAMIRIQAENRGIALVGPGYYRPLTSDEEVQNSDPLITRHVTGNDRQFDLWVSMAFAGQATAAPVTDAQVKQIADLIAAQLEVPPAEVDYAAIATAVNDDAAARLES